MKKQNLFIAFVTITNCLYTQNQPITLEEIWQKGVFQANYIRGFQSMNDGIHYTTVESGAEGKETLIEKYEYKTGKKTQTLLRSSDLKHENKTLTIDDYQFSNDEKKLLIASETEKIYRHSTRENYYVYDLTNKTTQKVTSGDKQMYASFSPTGNSVAFVRNNNLFIKDFTTDKETAVTNDGKTNNIINGAADWVYEEEFGFSKAYFWSPDGKKIAYYKFDESKVKEFEMNEFMGELYPSVYKFKYPKAGEANSVVSIHIYDINTSQTVTVDVGNETDQYIPRIKWTKETNSLAVLRMSRLQNKLELLLANATTGKTNVILTEESDTYIEVTDDLTFLPDNSFIWMSDMDGNKHMYHYNKDGKLIKQLTKGKYDVAELKGYDAALKCLYYTAAELSPAERELYCIQLDGSNKKKLSTLSGTNDAVFSSGYKYYVNTFSDVNTPYFITLHTNAGKQVRILEDNSTLKEKVKKYNPAKKEFFEFKTSEGVSLKGWIMKPNNIDTTRKYPVLMTFYGGPHHNEVNNSWGGNGYIWHAMLAQKGYIVACVDNRGTEMRGRDFKKCTYKQLGKHETNDQIETAKYLGNIAYVDKTRIGVQGWSFGGYLTSLCMTKGANYFKSGIAVAPVTNWRFYDTIYTERYLSTPQKNPEGYDENSPIHFTDKLKGKYMLIHGTGDDNVHLQNSIEMSRALIKSNKQFLQFFYPDKNHSIYGGNTRLHLYTQMTDFILNNL